MIKYENFVLPNGLDVYVVKDTSTPIAAFNMLYKVGSRDEHPQSTGFAHLYEHLMFCGSKNIPNYDTPLQKVGGQNNAYTTSDYTNYYITLPANNIETAFWLESDRLMSLALDEDTLEREKSVVIEEFKQRYLNQPYGDLSFHLYKQAYKKHPYKWPTIGKEPRHIKKVDLSHVAQFGKRFYHPNNAILVIGGPVDTDEIYRLCYKWFAEIPLRVKPKFNYAQEVNQRKPRIGTVRGDVPLHAIHKTFLMPGRLMPGYHEVDLLSDILGSGRSSLLTQKFTMKKRLFTNINAYITGTADPGLVVISGNLNPGVDPDMASDELDEFLFNFTKRSIKKEIFEKVKNQVETTLVYQDLTLLNRVSRLAYHVFLGDTGSVNTEKETIANLSKSSLELWSKRIFKSHRCNTIKYLKQKNS